MARNTPTLVTGQEMSKLTGLTPATIRKKFKPAGSFTIHGRVTLLYASDDIGKDN